MNKFSLTFLSVLSISLIALFYFSVSNNNQKLTKGRNERIGKQILEHLIQKTDNEHPAINSSLKGKTILINVWATWCVPCKKEIPELNQLVDKYKGRDDMAFIALSNQDSTTAINGMETFDIDFDFDQYYSQKEMIDLLYSYKLTQESYAIPLSILINQKGEIEYYYLGYQKETLKAVKDYLTSL